MCQKSKGNQKSRFDILAGPLVFQGDLLKDTYVLEIDYSASEKAHKARLGETFIFGSHLYVDYAEVAHDLASKFCEENGFTINNHLNSWPIFQAVISRTRH